MPKELHGRWKLVPVPSGRAHQIPDCSGIGVAGLLDQRTNVSVVVSADIGEAMHGVTKQILKSSPVRTDLGLRQFGSNIRQDNVVLRVSANLKPTVKTHDIRCRHHGSTFGIGTRNIEGTAYAVL